MRFFLTPPTEHRPSLIVETHERITREIQEKLRADMYGRSCANGMLLDNDECLVFRDSFDDMGPQSVNVEMTLQTDEVLSMVRGATLDEKVQTWLELLSAAWNHAIPPLDALSGLVYDIVPAAVGAQIQIVGERP